jgi:hypothetical protein
MAFANISDHFFVLHTKEKKHHYCMAGSINGLLHF